MHLPQRTMISADLIFIIPVSNIIMNENYNVYINVVVAQITDKMAWPADGCVPRNLGPIFTFIRCRISRFALS